MDWLKNVFIIIVVMFIGFFYYRSSISKIKDFNDLAFGLKLILLFLSLVLAFFEKDILIVGNMVFGGRISLMLIIVIEIVDALVDRKKK